MEIMRIFPITMIVVVVVVVFFVVAVHCCCCFSAVAATPANAAVSLGNVGGCPPHLTSSLSSSSSLPPFNCRNDAAAAAAAAPRFLCHLVTCRRCKCCSRLSSLPLRYIGCRRPYLTSLLPLATASWLFLGAAAATGFSRDFL